MHTPVTSGLQLGPRLGKGHFAAVHAGQHPVHGPVAVKVMEREPSETVAEWTQRRDGLLAEGRHLKSAEHDRVVRVFDVTYDATADRVFLVLELCPNGSLQDAFEAGPSQLERVRDHITDAALGLDAVHARNLLHRDIKPANILLAANRRAKLGDFGLVTDNIVLGYASAAGYSDHLAYEVWHNGITSIKTDIWALGMTAYRLIHGEVFYQHLLQPPRHVVANGGFALSLPWLAHVPADWQRFIRKCMHDDSALRHQNAPQVLQALARLPVSAGWICSFDPRETSWVRETRDRRIEVVHRILSPRKHTWEAVSHPQNPGGRSKRLAGSTGSVPAKEAHSGLRAFFTS